VCLKVSSKKRGDSRSPLFFRTPFRLLFTGFFWPGAYTYV